MTTVVDYRISTNPYSFITPTSTHTNAEPVTLGRLLGIPRQDFGDFV